MKESVYVKVDFKNEVIEVKINDTFIPEYNREAEKRLHYLVETYFPHRTFEKNNAK